MEFKMNQIWDTRERISLKHIKSLDIVEKEIHWIMPNSLTEDQLQQNWKNDEQMSSLELIKNDLDNVDDVFALGFGGGPINHDNENQEEGNLQDEWLNTSSENHDVSLDNTEANVIKEMQNDKQMLMEQL